MRLQTIFGIVCAVAVITGVIFVVRGQVLLMVVLSGSMVPVMMPGDVIVVTPQPPAQIGIGDIISYRASTEKERIVVTHRVIAIDRGKELFTTKGDNNNVMDEAPVGYQDVMGKAVSLIPLLGYLVFMQRQLMLYLVFLPAAIIIFTEMRGMMMNPALQLKREREERKRERLPVSIKYGRLAAIFVLASLPFWVLAYPSLGGLFGGAGGEGAKYGEGNTLTIQGEGLVDQVYVLRTEGRPAIPGYGVVSPGESVEVQVDDPVTARVSLAPAIIPIFWVLNLASVHPALPALALGLLPGLLILSALSPLWMMRRRARTKRKRRMLPFGTGAV